MSLLTNLLSTFKSNHSAVFTRSMDNIQILPACQPLVRAFHSVTLQGNFKDTPSIFKSSSPEAWFNLGNRQAQVVESTEGKNIAIPHQTSLFHHIKYYSTRNPCDEPTKGMLSLHLCARKDLSTLESLAFKHFFFLHQLYIYTIPQSFSNTLLTIPLIFVDNKQHQSTSYPHTFSTMSRLQSGHPSTGRWAERLRRSWMGSRIYTWDNSCSTVRQSHPSSVSPVRKRSEYERAESFWCLSKQSHYWKCAETIGPKV